MIQDYDAIICAFNDQISLEESEIGMRNDWRGMSFDGNSLIFIVFFIDYMLNIQSERFVT